jgi:hypothetical protein
LISKLELLLVNVCHNPLSSDFISLVLPDWSLIVCWCTMLFAGIKLYLCRFFCLWRIYPLVNFHITMENHHAINGKIHYNWPFSSSQTVRHYQRVKNDKYTLSPGETSYFHRPHHPMSTVLQGCLPCCLWGFLSALGQLLLTKIMALVT